MRRAGQALAQALGVRARAPAARARCREAEAGLRQLAAASGALKVEKVCLIKGWQFEGRAHGAAGHAAALSAAAQRPQPRHQGEAGALAPAWRGPRRCPRRPMGAAAAALRAGRVRRARQRARPGDAQAEAGAGASRRVTVMGSPFLGTRPMVCTHSVSVSASKS
jgi:hypothetical protein